MISSAKGLLQKSGGNFRMPFSCSTKPSDAESSHRTNEHFFYSRGVSYEARGLRDRALGHFDAAIALLPQFPNSYIYRALIWTHRREFDRARDDLCRRFGPNLMIALGRRDLAMAFSDWARYANRTKLLSQCERFLVSKEEGAALSMR